MKALHRWGWGEAEDTKRTQEGAWEEGYARPDIQDATSTSPSVLMDKSILRLGVAYGLTCGRIVDGEDDPSTQAHALGVDDGGADQSCNGGIYGRALLLEDGSGKHSTE